MRNPWSCFAIMALFCFACPSSTPSTTEPTVPKANTTENNANTDKTTSVTEPKKTSMYPETRSENITETIFGVAVSDPYRWLEDPSKPDVKVWMDEQDALTRKNLSQISFRPRLVDRLKDLYYVDSISTPARRGKRLFYSRSHADKEKPVVYWKDGANGKENVLLDPNQMSKDGTVSLGRWVPSYDGKKVAYALRERGADESTFYLMNVDSGKTYETDVIQGGKYASPSWTPKGDGFYYTYLPTDPSIPVAERPGYAEIRYHKIGTSQDSDKVIYEKTGDPKLFIGAELSRDGHWLFVYKQHGWNSNELYFKDARKKNAEFVPFVENKDALYNVVAWKDQFYVLTNEDAPRWRIFAVNPRKPARKNWKEIVSEDSEGGVLDDMDIIGGHLALTYVKNASSEIKLYSLKGKFVRAVKLPGIGASSGLVGNPDHDEAYFSFNSFTRPTTIYKTSIKSGKTEIWNQVKLPIDPSPYQVDQVWYTSKDGTKVSMFLVHKKDMPKNGSTPFLLYGYGGFSVNLYPSFSSTLYPWLEAGGGYAVPNLRGGGEYGEAWHKAGMLHNKQNVFDDFIGAAEFLIQNKYTNSDRLGIYGGSNGGLLVGAAMTQRPELFRAVLCAVPLLDMVRYHLFGSGKTWISEYGSSEEKEQFNTLYSYSPYHKVTKRDYPAMLMLSADNDDRVDPMHARKMIAALQKNNTSQYPMLIRIEKNAGHGGAGLVKQAVEVAADRYAFLMKELGLTPPM